ncbi:DMT family transporter [Cognatishimia sp. WU-CL00825]|uniref:DMT family transporter n=1 Tax=Cognatishimia sp. WU-CL00825 TaxID=3127658 RepID=UPI003104E961
MPLTQTHRSQGLALFSIFSATASSVLLKTVDVTPISEAVAIRSVFGFIVLGFIILAWSTPNAAPIGRSAVFRAALDALAALTLSFSIFLLPLSLLASIHATLPILSIVLSAIMLSERMSIQSWVALILALAGTLLILSPGIDYSIAGVLLAIISLFAYAFRDVVTRRMPQDLDLRKVTLISLAFVSLSSLAVSAQQPWVKPATPELLAICLAGLTFLVANFMIVAALHRCAVNRIAPLRYTAILWALIFDWAVWGYLPEPIAWVGIGLIMAAGLLLMLQPHPAEQVE